MKKIKVALIFGGKSGEHEVSIISARSVYKAINKKQYEVIPIALSQKGDWIKPKNSAKYLSSDKIPDVKKNEITNVEILNKYDIAFPVLHGTYGEDGTIQGLFEILNIPFVGSGVLGSALAMDKIVSKKIFRENNISVLPAIEFINKKNNLKNVIQLTKQKLKFPVFVKPANLGSSVGISKVQIEKKLPNAIKLAQKFDNKIIIERSLEDAREIECSVLGNDKPKASILGEIVPSNEFYDYSAKYIDNKSKLIIPAKLPKPTTKTIQEIAVKAFSAVNCFGLARVDFLVQKQTNEIYLNEINTMPGFTSISMYPKLWQASGLSYPILIDKLIKLGLEKYQEKKGLKTTYE